MDEYGKTQHRGDGAAGTLTSDDGTPTRASRGSGTDGDGDGSDELCRIDDPTCDACQ